MVVRTAKRESDMPPACLASLLACGREGRSGCRCGEPFGEVVPFLSIDLGRHRKTASTLARQGWTCSGTLKTTSTTIAARAIVELSAGGYMLTMFPEMLLPKER
ncbi:hypothetical protein KEM55_007696 [Ascosphaera atra]|nr:hypothetical protein KEM55_007696 [Ascosphaera atra]